MITAADVSARQQGETREGHTEFGNCAHDARHHAQDSDRAASASRVPRLRRHTRDPRHQVYVGIVEWACIEALHGHLDDGELTLGTHVDLSHDAPTVPGSKMTVVVRLVEVDGLSLVFEVEARDDHAVISSGVHRRSIIDGDRFENRIAQQTERARP